MNSFISYLDVIEQLKKEKKFDLAWEKANEAIIGLKASGSEDWYMFYYQMADILAREEKWMDALEKMGLCIHYLGRLGGMTHERFVLRLLKKINQENKFNDYLDIVKKSQPRDISEALHKLFEL